MIGLSDRLKALETKQHSQKKCPEKLVSSKGDETSAKRWDQWCFLFSGFVVAQTHQREEPGLTR